MEIIKLEEKHWKLLKNKYNYPANVAWNQEDMLTNGYLIQEGQMLLGSYLLHPVAESVVQLKQMTLFSQATPELLLVIFQTILEDIHQSNISSVVVNSHSEQLDALLQHFEFKHAEPEKLPPSKELSTEKAWVYQVN
ncbi:hypothetical protein SAMN05421743_10764 [Thalassobacillus cyri]|uniref:N-acetyltransferase domain-containing protein n=1 Tax=Thalassobacillus cyri TaxID=571932 RepID=A0A1H4DBY7_9BACI|nr:hypothetical protein [Thalassobacillus cyri]SEA69970.1 hypothetical protein SAMN05421743_10764 [Thalassobacillus cyri]